MNFLEIINKIKKLTVDDKVKASKMFAIICVGLVIIIFVIGTAWKSISKIISNWNKVEYVYEEAPKDYAEQVEEHVYTVKKDDKGHIPNETQKSEFTKYNCLEFSDLKVANNTITFEAINTSESKVKDISVSIYNKDKEVIATLTTPAGKSIKPKEKYVFEGAIYEDDVYIDNYMLNIGGEFVEVNLTNQSAITSSNSEDEFFE